MGNNRDYSDYSVGYEPEAVEHDLQLISQLMRGRRKLTPQLAQEIYYRIKNERLAFRSDTGKNFLNKLYGNMTEAQIQETDRAVRLKNKKRLNRKRLLRINRRIAIVMLLVVLVSSVLSMNWNLLMDVRTNYETKKLQAKVKARGDLADAAQTAGKDADANAGNGAIIQAVAEGQAVEAPEQAEEPQKPEIMGKFTQLYEENEDFAGWLRIPGTKIDYPVMSKEGDNDYYLDKNFNRQQDKNGLLILDYRNDVTAQRQNLIIYGHNMSTGVMFGTLKNYKDKAFCEEHGIIRFDTLYEECEYRVVAAMLASVAYEDEDVFRYYDAIDISTQENFDAFHENMLANALYMTDETIQYGDTCLVLSTCDHYKEDGRFVVIAKKAVD